jgi:hypothetical protein
MKNNYLPLIKICLPILLAVLAFNFARGQNEINIQREINVLGSTRPIPVSLDGFSGEVAEVLKFDLYVQGFSFVSPDAAQYQISGSNSGAMSPGASWTSFSKKIMLSRSYTGATLRREAHAFATTLCKPSPAKKASRRQKSHSRSSPPAATEKFTFRRFRRPQRASRHARRRDCRRARVGSGTAGALLHVLPAGQPGHFLPQLEHRPAPHRRRVIPA